MSAPGSENLEAARIRAEYARRERTIAPDFYALSRTSNLFAHHGRERELRELLDTLGLLPLRGRSLLEVGCGAGEWFATFERFGLELDRLAGIDLDEGRLARARDRAALADLRLGDASRLPWADASFDVVFQSTVFSSVLSATVREALAREIVRVLKRGGVLLWYDFAYDNPANPNVKGLRLSEIERLFPHAQLRSKRVTLAPPIARRLVPRSWVVAELLERARVLNTHLLVAVRP